MQRRTTERGQHGERNLARTKWIRIQVNRGARWAETKPPNQAHVFIPHSASLGSTFRKPLLMTMSLLLVPKRPVRKEEGSLLVSFRDGKCYKEPVLLVPKRPVLKEEGSLHVSFTMASATRNLSLFRDGVSKENHRIFFVQQFVGSVIFHSLSFSHKTLEKIFTRAPGSSNTSLLGYMSILI